TSARSTPSHLLLLCIFSSPVQRPPRPTLFPYTSSSDLDYVRHIMSHRDGEYSLIGPAAGAARKLLGASMQMMEGHEFRRRRKPLTPMMGRQQLTRMAAIIADEFANRFARWVRFAETGEP